MYYWFHQSFYMAKAFPFIGGWLADRLLGDPEGWPHPVVGFGKVISLGEKTLNKGNDRTVKGGVMALILVAGTYLLCERILALAGYFHPIVASILSGIGVFYCLAGKTLVKEVKAVFEAVDRSTEEGRKQVGRIVGRDTSRLSPQEIRAAALETLAENLSDGVIAPMFWPAQTSRHDGLQNGEYARFDDRLQKRTLLRIRADCRKARRSCQLYPCPVDSMVDAGCFRQLEQNGFR